MVNEVELLEELPYFRAVQKHHGTVQYPPRSSLHLEGYDETSIAIITPDIRLPQHQLTRPTIESNEHYSALSGLCILLSILIYIIDVGTDVTVCYVLFMEGKLWWFGLTASFVIVAAIIVNVLSICWYLQNQRNASCHEAATPFTWFIRSLFHLLFLGQLFRYMHLFCNGCVCCGRQHWEDKEQHSRSNEARKCRNVHYQLFLQEDRDTALLSLLHSFLESAPQLILQLYILAQRTSDDNLINVFIQGGSAITSLFQMAWSITSYNCAVHRIMNEKKTSNTIGLILQFLWHFCTIGARACTLALFTKEYNYWLFPFCIGHWGIMTVWVMHQQTHFCYSNSGRLYQCKEYLFNMVIGIAYVVYFLNVKDEPTRYKYSAYYAIVFAENCILMTLWFFRNDPEIWYHIPALIAVFSSFAAGIIFMLFYYGFFHRTGKFSAEKRAAHCC